MSSTLSKTERKLPLSQMGKTNPFPKFCFEFPERTISPAANLPKKFTNNMFSNCYVPLFPYTMQETYDRSQTDGSMPTITLENEVVRTVIYPQYGGRVASLFDKVNQRELLFNNNVFQPANLAIRNAWFSGGIEWNGPLYGHSLLTCSDVYVARIKGPHGDGARIYEFDRSLQTAWQVDLFLDDKSPRLWIHVKTFNLNDYPVDYYWWTNIAVPQSEGTRVLAYTHPSGVSHTPDQKIGEVDFPKVYDFDGSYPERYPVADSIFFNMREDRLPWLASVNKDGEGIVYTSTANLCGRKFFIWGSNAGGRKWCDFLSKPGEGRYFEIQGGLQPTQLQTIPMPGHAEFEWTECIGTWDEKAADVHHPDFFHAVNTIQKNLEATSYQEEINRRHQAFCKIAQEPILENLWTGSAWGRLFEQRTQTTIAKSMRFDGKASAGEQVWFDYVNGKGLAADGEFGDWVSSPMWLSLLEADIKAGTATWKHHVMLAAALIEKNNFSEGQRLLEAANAQHETAAAWRLLATLHNRAKKNEAALKAYQRAWELSEPYADLAILYSRYLWQEKKKDDCVAFISSLPAHIRAHERIQILRAEIAFDKGDFKTVEEVLAQSFCTIREGENTLSDMWYHVCFKKEEEQRGSALTEAEKKAYMIKHAPPAAIDFRMSLAEVAAKKSVINKA